MSVQNHAAVAGNAERSIERLLAPFLAAEQDRRTRLSEDEVRQISTDLNRIGKDAWSKVPRLYVVLRMVKHVQVIDEFIDDGISDIWFPFNHKTLPGSLRSPSARTKFLESQDLVFTKAFDLEREDGQHRHFSKADDIPLDNIQVLGKGGFGYVDHVVSTITYKEYARKLILRGRTFRKDAEVLRDFERELGHLKKLSHKHIVKLIGSYTDPKFVGILMTPVAECNLKDFLSRPSISIGERSKLRTFYGCLSTALCYLHENGVRHKDIKPQNVLVIMKGPQVFLTDFGASVDWSDFGHSTTTGATIKTPRYCAPEVAEHLPRNSSSDIWSLGCVFLEIWTVLKGASLASLDDYLNENGSRSACYYLNSESAMAWCRNLEAKDVNRDENVPMQWILAMLQRDRDSRWTAQMLVDRIQEANDDPELGYLFSGLCCVSDDDSTNSGYSSRRSSRILEKTGASMVDAHYHDSENGPVVERESSSNIKLADSVTPEAKATISTGPLVSHELSTENEVTLTPRIPASNLYVPENGTVSNLVDNNELLQSSGDITEQIITDKMGEKTVTNAVSADRHMAMDDGDDIHQPDPVEQNQSVIPKPPSEPIVQRVDISRSADFHGYNLDKRVLPERFHRPEMPFSRQSSRSLSGSSTGKQPNDVVSELDATPHRQPAIAPMMSRDTNLIEELSTEDFAKCSEPWAKSSLLSWITHVAGNYPHSKAAISQALIGLFKNKVVALSLVTAESLAKNFIDDMILEKILAKTNNGLCFVTGTTCGVLWQLTNEGCYSAHPYLASDEQLCYSYSCMKSSRTLSPAVDVHRTSDSWVEFYHLTQDDLYRGSPKEIERQNVLHEIVTGEEDYIINLDVLREVYRDALVHSVPSIITATRANDFFRAVFGLIDTVKSVNANHLLGHLRYRQKMTGPWLVGFSDIFREWLRSAKSIYVEYAKAYPRAEYMIREEQTQNSRFQEFLHQARLHRRSNRLGWDSHLKAPISRFQRYILLLETVSKYTPYHLAREKQNLGLAIDEMKVVLQQLNTVFAKSTENVNLLAASRKIYLGHWVAKVDLALHHPDRRLLMEGILLYQSDIAYSWIESHTFLFDNYFVLSKTMRRRFTTGTDEYDGEVCEVSTAPIPTDLLSLENVGQPILKRSPKTMAIIKKLGNIGRSVTTKPTEQSAAATALNDSQGEMLYPMSIKALGNPAVLTLFAHSAASRQSWCEAIASAQKQHAMAVHEQGNQPFKIRVLADEAFRMDSKREVQKLPGFMYIALDEALRELEGKDVRQPSNEISSGQSPNCATVFYQRDGHAICLVGTDDGMYVSEYGNARGWTRWTLGQKITHVAFLEGYDMLVVVADDLVRTYSLEEVYQHEDKLYSPVRHIPSGSSNVSHPGPSSCFAAGKLYLRTVVIHKTQERRGVSTFKVMEPVLPRKENPRSTWDAVLNGPRSEKGKMLRHTDEFSLPVKAHGINIYNNTWAILTSIGIEVMDLSSKRPRAVPNLSVDSKRTPRVQRLLDDVTGLLHESKPLGMFRLSQGDFVIAYENCAIYVDLNGKLSRDVVIRFSGKARSACLSHGHLMIFYDDMLEIREVDSGQLRQAIPGKDIKLLDDGGNMSSHINEARATAPKTVKFCMQHPDYQKLTYIVVELLPPANQKASPAEDIRWI